MKIYSPLLLPAWYVAWLVSQMSACAPSADQLSNPALKAHNPAISHTVKLTDHYPINLKWTSENQSYYKDASIIYTKYDPDNQGIPSFSANLTLQYRESESIIRFSVSKEEDAPIAFVFEEIADLYGNLYFKNIVFI